MRAQESRDHCQESSIPIQEPGKGVSQPGKEQGKKCNLGEAGPRGLGADPQYEGEERHEQHLRGFRDDRVGCEKLTEQVDDDGHKKRGDREQR
nr:hypothetical protein [Flaviflexus massiliensis]